jgi:hypothetical protein
MSYVRALSRAVAVVLALTSVSLTTGFTSRASAADDTYFTDISQWWSTFYPVVKDGYRDATFVYFSTDNDFVDGSWTVQDADGATVYTSSRFNYIGEEEVRWNGRDDSGNAVGPGNYVLTITVEEDPIGSHEGDQLTHAFSRSVTVKTDVVTRHERVRWVPGRGTDPYWDSATATGRCRAMKLYREALLDCWGKGHARASYAFWLPTRGEERGAGPVRNVKVWFGGEIRCCAPGTVTKRITHPRKHIYRGVVTVTNWRAYSIRSFNATYSYKKRL